MRASGALFQKGAADDRAALRIAKMYPGSRRADSVQFCTALIIQTYKSMLSVPMPKSAKTFRHRSAIALIIR